jgi:hypothetical protein
MGCAAQYEVVQKLDVNMYHLYNTRTQEVRIVLSRDELTEGELIKLKQVKIIADIENSEYK